MSIRYQKQAHQIHARRMRVFLPVALLMVAGLVACAAPAAAAAAATNMAVPRIQFATPVHDFGRIKGGEVVKYTYFFTNVGSAMLEVPNVHVSCGCTTAGDWSRQVAPGGTGSIPIQFNSGNFRGDVTKMVTVACNDAAKPSVMLQFKAQIWMPIEVIPQFASLNVTTESPSNATIVRIVNNEETPVTLSAPLSSNPAFAAELRTNQPGKEFEVIVRTVPPLPAGVVQGQITLNSSSTNLPVVSITAWANVQPAILVTPAQIFLPGAPLATPRPYTISIRNNAANALVLTDPEVNVAGVEVQLKETQPGRYFLATVTFPAGFEIVPGRTLELTLKSNHPQFPLITVPIQQPPRLTPTAAAGPAIPPASPPAASR